MKQYQTHHICCVDEMHKPSFIVGLGLCLVALAAQLAAADQILTIGEGNRADFVDLNGQIKLYPVAHPTTFIKLKLARLEEVNVTGSVEQAVTNFQADSFTWTAPELQTIGGVNATSISMRKLMNSRTNTTFGITALVFHENTRTAYGTGTVDVYSRAVKFTVQIEKWPFLSPFNKLRLVAEVLYIGGDAAANGQAKQLPSGETRYAFGPGAVDTQSQSINDGLMMNAQSKLTAIGSAQAMQWTFNSFTSNLEYDSTLHVFGAEEEEDDRSAAAASMNQLSLCAIAIASAAVLARVL